MRNPQAAVMLFTLFSIGQFHCCYLHLKGSTCWLICHERFLGSTHYENALTVSRIQDHPFKNPKQSNMLCTVFRFNLVAWCYPGHGMEGLILENHSQYTVWLSELSLSYHFESQLRRQVWKLGEAKGIIFSSYVSWQLLWSCMPGTLVPVAV